jgi:hypothetical protein
LNYAVPPLPHASIPSSVRWLLHGTISLQLFFHVSHHPTCMRLRYGIGITCCTTK